MVSQAGRGQRRSVSVRCTLVLRLRRQLLLQLLLQMRLQGQQALRWDLVVVQVFVRQLLVVVREH